MQTTNEFSKSMNKSEASLTKSEESFLAHEQVLMSNKTESDTSFASIGCINYDNMDKLNEMTPAGHSFNNSFNRNVFNESQVSLKANSTRDFNCSLMANQTMEGYCNQSSIDRINQLVMQSVERVKRTALSTYTSDDLLANLNSVKPTGEVQLNKSQESCSSLICHCRELKNLIQFMLSYLSKFRNSFMET
jgi:hypothetical protein